MNGWLTVERMEANQKVKSRIFVIDNYDSFTFNLVQYFGELGCDLVVHRNDQITLDEIEHLQVDRIVISPGPGRPSQAGISIETIRNYAGRKPILGVCLGHQAIGEAFGATVVRAEKLMHGKTSSIYHAGDSIFSGLPSPFEATRYHSLVVSRSGLPESLRVTAWTEDGVIMGLEHSEYPVYGVQFHPESILTRVGKDILRNFLCSENLRKS